MKPTVFRTASNAVDRTDHRFPRFLTLTACIRHIPTDIPPAGCGCRTCESVLYYSSSQLLTKNLISQIYSSTSPKSDAPRFTYSNDPKLLLAYAKSLGHSLPWYHHSLSALKMGCVQHSIASFVDDNKPNISDFCVRQFSKLQYFAEISLKAWPANVSTWFTSIRIYKSDGVPLLPWSQIALAYHGPHISPRPYCEFRCMLFNTDIDI